MTNETFSDLYKKYKADRDRDFQLEHLQERVWKLDSHVDELVDLIEKLTVKLDERLTNVPQYTLKVKEMC